MVIYKDYTRKNGQQNKKPLKLKATRQFLVYADIRRKRTYHKEATEASAVPNKKAGEEVKEDKTGDTFRLRDQNSGKFTTQRYVINRLKCGSSSYIWE